MKPVKFQSWWWVLLSLLVLGLIFWPWFTPGFLSYGDWWHILPSRAVEYFQHLLIWDAARNFGAPLNDSAAHNAIHWFYGFFWQNFKLSPSISARLFWFIPFIVFSWVGAWQWGKLVTGRRFGAFITALLYTFNTFSLNTVQGGQMTLAVSYAIGPLSLYLMWRLVAERERRLAAWLGLTIAIQAIYDVRMLAITLLAGIVATIWQLYLLPKRERRVDKLLVLIILVAFATIALSSYWLIPILTGTAGTAGVPVDYTNTGWISSLSYATVAHGLATNHVWWPWSEGVINPIQPLFYLTLLLTLVSLWQWKRNRFTPYLLVLVVLGVFFLKGSNEPFPNTYAWLFTHVPGFIMFRDPAKFFMLLMLGMAPAASLGAIYLIDWAKHNHKSVVAGVIFILLWLPLYPLWVGQRHGTFEPKSIPQAYVPFQNFYLSDQSFGRTLWVPNMQRYIPYTQQHPAVGLKEVAEGAWRPLQQQDETFESVLNHPYAEWLIKHAGIKWVGLPLDSENEIYRHYGSYDYYLNMIQSKPWLHEIESGSPDIKLFADEAAKDEIYVAKQVVALDQSVVNDYQPTLNEDDILLFTQGSADERYHSAALERLRGIALNLDNLMLDGQTATWQWQTPVPFSGRIQLPSELSQYPLAIDGKQILTNKSPDSIVSEDTTLTAGDHQLTLDFGKPANLAYQDSFAKVSWTPCQDARGRLIFPDSYYHADENAGETDVQMIYSSEEAPGCMSLKLGVLEPGLYRIKILSRTETGSGLEAKLLHDKVNVTGDTLPKSDDWRELTILADVAQNQPGELLLLANPTLVGDQVMASKVAIANIVVQRLINSTPDYLGLLSSKVEAVATLPAVSFERVKPGTYTVSVAASDKPAYLILNQAYNEGWRLKGVTALEHLAANGSANAWLLPAHQQPLNITIQFGDTTPFRWGLIVSLVALVIVLNIGLTRSRSHSRHRK